jgi:hypothetical protein
MAQQTDDKAAELYSAKWWLRQIARYEKTFDPWTQQGEKLLKLYAKQTKTRAIRIAQMLRSGEWPTDVPWSDSNAG